MREVTSSSTSFEGPPGLSPDQVGEPGDPAASEAVLLYQRCLVLGGVPKTSLPLAPVLLPSCCLLCSDCICHGCNGVLSGELKPQPGTEPAEATYTDLRMVCTAEVSRMMLAVQ